MTKDTITVKRATFETFIIAFFELGALEGAGVDNWHGCDYAYDELLEKFGDDWKEGILKLVDGYEVE